MTQHSISSFIAFGVAILIWPLGTEAASFTSASASVSIDRPGLTKPCAFSETNTDGLAASAAVACEGIGNVGSSAYASSQAAASGVFIPGFESTLTVSTNDQTIYAYSDSKTSATAGVSATIVVLGGIGQGTLSLLFDMSGAAAVTDFGFNPVAATSTQLSVIASTTLPSVLTFCHLPFF